MAVTAINLDTSFLNPALNPFFFLTGVHAADRKKTIVAKGLGLESRV